MLSARQRAIAADADSDDPLQAVGAIYQRALADHDPSQSAADRETQDEFLAHFTADTRALWIGRKPPRLAGPILNVWFGPSALPGTVTLGSMRPRSRSDAAATVEVVVFVRGERRAIEVVLTRSEGAWLVANVRYPDDDLVSYLQRN